MKPFIPDDSGETTARDIYYGGHLSSTNSVLTNVDKSITVRRFLTTGTDPSVLVNQQALRGEYPFAILTLKANPTTEPKQSILEYSDCKAFDRSGRELSTASIYTKLYIETSNDYFIPLTGHAFITHSRHALAFLGEISVLTVDFYDTSAGYQIRKSNVVVPYSNSSDAHWKVLREVTINSSTKLFEGNLRVIDLSSTNGQGFYIITR